MTHQCPGPECRQSVDIDRLACSRHWYQVPAAIRSAVYRAWKNGAGSGSAAHLAAMKAATERMRPL